MITRFGLPEHTIRSICGVLARHPEVEKAILYGSRAKGNFKPGSDIDLTLVGGPDLTLSVLRQILQELDDLLLPYTVDLSLFQYLRDPELLAHIQRVGVIFYAKTASAPPQTC